MHERVKQDFTVKFKWSRDLMDLRKQEKIFFSVRDYQKAEDCKRRADSMEALESEHSDS